MKKAFTLIELLSVIIILGVLAAIITPISLSVIKNSKEKAYEAQIDSFKNIAQLYATEHVNELNENITTRITAELLKKKGYLHEDILNPKTNEKLLGCIKAKYNAEYKQFEYQYDESCETDIACFDYEDTSVATNYDIDYDMCINMFSELVTDNLTDFCKGTGKILISNIGKMGIRDYINYATGMVGFEVFEQFSMLGLIKNITYENGIAITNYKCGTNRYSTTIEAIGKDLDPSIPKQINDKPVLKIGNGNGVAFSDASTMTGGINSVILPEGLLYVDAHAFNTNHLKDITFSSTILGINNAAFASNDLTKLNLPENLQFIGSTSFYNNEIDQMNFPPHLMVIGSNALMQNKLTNVIIPSTVEYIDTQAFSYNKISSLEVPITTFIMGGVFNNNLLPPDKAFIYKNNGDGTVDLSTLISYAGSEKSLTIPNNVKTIFDSALRELELVEVIIPSSVTSIGEYAFENNKFTKIIIPSSITSIGSGALMSNYNLTNIVNTTGKAFDWGKILNNKSGYNFVTGTVKVGTRSVTVSAS